jgi:carboxyl-terminal processing protease
VQTAFQLDESKTLKMTTAKYYIPSGRLIQKPDYLRTDVATDDQISDSIFVTRNGRKVVANGGIAPDFLVTQKRTPSLTSEIWRKGLFFQFSSRYQKEKKLKMPVIITDPIIVDFQDFLDSKDINPKSEGKKQLEKLEGLLGDASETDKRIEHSVSVLRKYYETDKNQMFQDEIDDIRLMLERDLSWVVGGLSGRIESSFDDDPAILKALEILSDQYVYGSTLDPSMN